MTELIKNKLDVFKDFIHDAGLKKAEYQERAIEWCLEKEHSVDDIKGGVIGDEMGLGKTIVSLGLIVSNVKQRTLIVLPTTLVSQWKSKIESILGIEPLVYHGKNRHKFADDAKDSFIVLTTYGVISQLTTKHRKIKKEDTLLHNIEWDRIIFDEAHHLRNVNTSRHECSLLLKSDIKWCLTGTPIQNRKKDVMMLFHIIGFEYKYIKQHIIELIETNLLRRRMQDVGLSLPPLKSETIIVDWCSFEEKILCELLTSHIDITSSSSSSSSDKVDDEDIYDTYNTVHDINYYSKLISKMCGDGDSTTKLTTYLRARQLCITSVLFKKKIDKLIEIGELDTTYRQIYRYSSKISAVTNTILSNKKNTHRKIVFCHFIEEIKQVYESIIDTDDVNKYNVKHVAIYSGSLTLEERHRILENDDIEVLIMQIQTGCEGLNLQQYSEIYIVSPNWNPALEDQAVARCHRQGQIKETTVYRFIMEGSENLDTYIRETQYEKRKSMEVVEPPFIREFSEQ